MSKFCKQCGTPLADNATFCPKCGTAQSTPQNLNQAPVPNQVQFPNQVPPRGLNQTSNNNTIVFVIIGVVVFIAIWVLGFFVVFNGDINEVKETFSIGTQQKPAVEKNTKSNPTSAEKPKDNPAPRNTGVITGTEVRMRVGPGLNENIIGYFDKGEQVEILESRPGWAKVKRSNGAVGWVSDQFCKF